MREPRGASASGELTSCRPVAYSISQLVLRYASAGSVESTSVARSTFSVPPLVMPGEAPPAPATTPVVMMVVASTASDRRRFDTVLLPSNFDCRNYGNRRGEPSL